METDKMEAQKIGNKYRIYPTPRQRSSINQTMGCCRLIYNWGLDKHKEAYEKSKTTLSKGDLYKLFATELRTEKEFLGDISTSAVVSTLRNLDKAYSSFFKKNTSYPKYKRKQSSESFTVQVDRKSIDVDGGTITLPKIGKVKCVYHRDIIGCIEAGKPYVTVSRTTTGQYYISFKSVIYVPDAPTCKADETNTVGIDLGVKDLAIADNGVKYPKVLIDRKLDKRIKHTQRMLSKKKGSKKGEAKSKSYTKTLKKLNKLNERKARRREHYQYNTANAIASMGCKYIGLETLNIKGMMAKGGAKKKGLNRNIANNALSSFKQRIDFKAMRNGKKVVYVDRFFPSSKICHCCGYKNNGLRLNDRNWVCPECGGRLDRDTNAAINIKTESIKIVNSQ